jgi:hypothetical protein
MTMTVQRNKRAKISHIIHRQASVVGEKRTVCPFGTRILHGKSTLDQRNENHQIQRSCEHGGLYPLDPYNRLVSRRTGLFYNVRKGILGVLALEERLRREVGTLQTGD